MFDKIYNMLGESTPSYKDRLKSIDDFFKKHDLYKELWPEQPNTPLSIVWAITTSYPEVFMQQLGSMMQLDGILRPEDELILVADVERKADVLSSKFMTKQYNSKGVIVQRPFPGDGPELNWDVGASYATNDKVLFLRDLGLFFQPWDLIRTARMATVGESMLNFSAVLGPVWSRFSDRWMYLIHPRFAPNPFLFALVLNKRNYNKMGGFDTRLSRGFDHTGELDFLLRWHAAGFSYEMTEDVHIFHPGISANSREELEAMQFESSINRKYFFDRYGEDFIKELRPPFKADVNMVEVNHAMTLDPLSEVILDDDAVVDMDHVKDPFDFAKWPNEKLVQEVI